VTTYTLRPRTIRSRDNYVICYNGVDVGRCYLRTLSNNERRWSWTIFIDQAKQVLGVPTAGYAATLDEANKQFRKSFDRMRSSG
jgi:hypothetical protein